MNFPSASVSAPERPWWRSPRAALALLFALVLGGLALRLTGLSFMLPHHWEPDSLVFVRQVEYLESGSDEAHRDVFYGYYPHLIPRLCALAPKADTRATPATLDEHLTAASASRVRIRHVIAALSILIVPGTWLLARRFLARSGALFASGLMATSVLHIWFAQETRPHGLSSVFALFAVVAALRLVQRADAWAYLVCGVTTCLAVCSLQNGVAVLPALVVAHCLRARDGTRHAHVYFGLVLAGTAVAVRAFYPFMFESSSGHDAAALEIEGLSLNLSGHGIRLSAFDGRGFGTAIGALKNYEPILFALGLVGLVLLLVRLARRRTPSPIAAPGGWRARLAGRASLLVVLAYVVPYFLVIGMYEHTYQRFVIPLLPYVACFAAWALFAISKRIVDARGPVPGGEALAFLLATTLFCAQSWAAVKLVAIRTAPDTGLRAGRWIAANLNPGSDRIAISPSLDLPLFRTPEALAAFPREKERTFPWIVHQRRLDDSASAGRGYDVRGIPMQSAEAREALARDAFGFVAALGADYAVIEHFTTNIRPYNEALRLALEKKAQLVARFSPMWVDTGDDLPLAYQDDDFERRAVWWLRLLFARSMGPVIEIYRLKP